MAETTPVEYTDPELDCVLSAQSCGETPQEMGNLRADQCLQNFRDICSSFWHRNVLRLALICDHVCSTTTDIVLLGSQFLLRFSSA